MSDAVTNAEVEDVLSSIRRLVSDDHRPDSRAVADGAKDPLLLTQALRVDDRDTALPFPTKDALPFSMETLISRDTLVLRDAVVPGDPKAGTAEKDTQKIGETEKNVPERSTHEASDITSATITAKHKPAQPSAASILSAKIAALETAIGNISGDWEPDTPGEDDYSGTQAPAMIWQENVDLDATGRPMGGENIHSDVEREPKAEARVTDPEVLKSDVGEEGAQDDADFLDEEGLRLLVADIVRSELQGELGARITRNVRKLVRREIHRALAARDLD